MQLTAAQFELVGGELESMIRAGEWDEVWRIGRLFSSGAFTPDATAFPLSIRSVWDGLGPVRQRDYGALVQELCDFAAPESGFELGSLGAVEADRNRYELYRLTSVAPAQQYASRLSICVVAGVHGDELDSVRAAVQCARRFAASPELTAVYALTIYPCLNPVGYVRMTRENGRGRDLNREFLRGSAEPEVRLIERELSADDFLGFLSPHSDYESFGLYAYAAGAVLSERLAKPALLTASQVIAINADPVIDGHPAEQGIINEKFPGSLGPLARGSLEPFDITFETPNLVAIDKRVAAQALAFETILHEYRAVAAESIYL